MLIIECNDEASEYMKVPAWYKAYDYLQSSWNWTATWPYIAPWVPVSSGVVLKIEAKFTNLNTNANEKELFATYGGGVNLQCNINSSWISINNWSSYTITPTTTSNWTTHTMTCTYNGWTSSSRNPYLFAQNEWDSAWYGRWNASYKLYYFKIYQDWVLVRDFQPCIRESDNKPWLRDRAGKTFYTNVSNYWNDFTVWND